MRIVVIALFFLTLYSCSTSKVKKSNIIPEEKFVQVLADIHFADGIMTSTGYRIERDSTKIGLYYDYILEKHQISQSDFDHTLQYYVKKTEDYTEIYEQVLEELSKREGELDISKEMD